VMVVDGGGSRRKALLGDLLAEQAVKNGWEGIVIYGAIRDAGTVANLSLGLKALGTTPWKTDRKGLGDIGDKIHFAGLSIELGDFIYCDLNGIATAKQPLAIP
jgi:regulator of ribonuclease activity A